MRSERHLSVEEEIMPYLDGELEPREADRVRRHLETCAACAGAAAGFSRTSDALRGWQVEAVPAFRSKVRDIRSSPAWWLRMPRRYAAVAAAAMLVGVVGVAWQTPRKAPIETAVSGRSVDQVTTDQPAAKATQAGGAGNVAYSQALTVVPEAQTGPLLVRTARLMVTSAEFESARSRVERIVGDAGGFLGQIVVSGSAREQRSLAATVRVPTAQFDKAMAALRALGTVTSEAQDGEDVTQQSVDLDARLTNARASEARLKTILEQRTGRLSDVLDVEREISRVRGEIERMEAERKNLDRRIAYASIEVTLLEERKAAMDLGPQPLGTRFRNAFVDGWTTAVGGVVEAGLVLTGLLPTVVVLTLFAAPLAIWLRRWRRRTASA
jgi:hypothetical protein